MKVCSRFRVGRFSWMCAGVCIVARKLYLRNCKDPCDPVFKPYNHPHQWQLTLHNPSDKERAYTQC